GKKAEAKQLIERLSAEHPYNANILLLAGFLYQEEENYSLALEKFDAAKKIQTKSVAAWVGSIYSSIGLDDYKEAETKINFLLSVEKDNVLVNYLQAVVAFELKDSATALNALNAVQQKNPEHQGALWLSSSLLYSLKRYDDAERQVKKFLRYQPQHAGARKILAGIYLTKKQAQDVIPLLQPLLKLNDAHVFSLLGSAYLQMGDLNKASYYFQSAAKLSPDSEQIKNLVHLSNISLGKIEDHVFSDPDFADFENIGQVYIISLLKQNKIQEAIDLLLSYKKKSQYKGNILVLLGRIYTQQNQYELAKAAFNEALKLNQQETGAHLGLAELYKKLGNNTKVQEQYKKALRISPRHLVTLLALADLSRKENNPNDYTLWLEKAIRLNPDATKPRILLTQFYVQTGDLEKANEIARSLLELQPDNISFLKMLADIEIADNEVSSAIVLYKKIIQIEPRLPQAYFWLAKAQYLWKQYEQAKVNFEESIKLGFSDITAYVALVNIALIKNQLSQAMLNADTLIQLFPDNALSYVSKGDVFMANNEPQLATHFYDLALEKQPLYQVIIKRYRAHVKFMSQEKAQDSVEKWLIQYPDNMQLRQALAIAYIKDDKYEQAIRQYEIVLKKQPYHVNIINNLALLYDKTGNAKSLEYAEIAYSLAPERPAILDTLGWLLLKNNYSNERALDLLYKALRGDPGSANIRYHYAKALLSVGKTKKALVQLNSIIPSAHDFESKRDAEQLLNELKKREL
ncbi:MAG: PEP-CTERM system TPR-repeat protein PrsT, partial [Thiotrichaceae bacterium]|nr:PEP-CTERM system TPR-repeat protein PrsT [Thiotrichaceae bacterium]